MIVGISSDQLNFSKKQKYPVCSQEHRIRIISALKCVDQVFVEESLELKESYIKKYNADVLLMGNDWAGKFDNFKSICNMSIHLAILEIEFLGIYFESSLYIFKKIMTQLDY